MPAAGGCKTKDGDGDVLPRAAAVDRMGRYLASEYEAQADAILDFELWDDTFVSVAQDPDCMEVAVTQRRPLSFFGTSFGLMGGNAPAKTKSPLELRVNGFSRIKAHYLDYLSP